MEKLLLTESHQGALSNFQLRDGSAAGPSGNCFSNELGVRGPDLQDQYAEQYNNEIEPLNFDMDQDGANDLMRHKNADQNLRVGDFPSLKDLETSNAFTKSNFNIAESKAQLML